MTTTLGARFFDRKLTVAVRWQAVAAKNLDDIPLDTDGNPVFPPTEAYNLINLYLGYQPSPDLLVSLAIENLFNEQYSRYLTAHPNPVNGQPPIAFPQPGNHRERAYQNPLRRGFPETRRHFLERYERQDNSAHGRL